MDALPPNVITLTFTVDFPPEESADLQATVELSLIGRVFWPLPKPTHNLLQAMARQWRISPHLLQVFEVPYGLIQFVLPTMEEKVQVFQSQPWAFKSAIINLVPWETPSQDLFDRMQFMPLTIQLKDLPAHCNNPAFASKLVQPLGHKVEIAELTDASTSHQKNKYLKPVPYEFHTYVTVTPSDAGASSSGTKGPPPSGALPDSVISVTDVPICDGTLLSSNCSRHIGFHCFTNNDLDFLSISVAGKSKERLEIDNCPPILSIAKANDSFLLSFSHLCNAFVCYVPHYNTNYDSSLRLFDFPPASLDLQVFK
ncbi:hypothetical protein LINGRAHAP2_LOCUS1922 [Linum grandiflorum]